MEKNCLSWSQVGPTFEIDPNPRLLSLFSFLKILWTALSLNEVKTCTVDFLFLGLELILMLLLYDIMLFR